MKVSSCRIKHAETALQFITAAYRFAGCYDLWNVLKRYSIHRLFCGNCISKVAKFVGFLDIIYKFAAVDCHVGGLDHARVNALGLLFAGTVYVDGDFA